MKRIIDILLSAIIFIIAAPLFILVMLIIQINMGNPIFFRQKRTGLNHNVFTLYKFRTMNDNKDNKNLLLSDEFRITAFGKFLRKSSLDELPSLINVVKGEMSLVGPRPLLIDYLKYYTSEQENRSKVKPGITGWAQINGRNKISWEEKFELDNWYVKNQSIYLDFKILIITLWKVLIFDSVNYSNNETMPYFKGSKKNK